MDALSDTPVVFLRGARQTGKTTLVKAVCAATERSYATLDSVTVLAAAEEDPAGFIRGLGKPTALDEAQRAPGLLLPIKEDVDTNRHAGRYLLTGSANVFALPTVADSLAGRMEVLTLHPLSQGEIAGVREDFIARLFAPDFPPLAGEPWTKDRLFAAMAAGGYPEVLTRPRTSRRSAWFESYLTTLVERDIRDIAQVQDRVGLTRLMALLGARSGTLHNAAEMGRAVGMNATTLARYLAVLEALFLYWPLPAWSANLGKRLTKSPKLHMTDTGFACHLCGADEVRLHADPALAGRLFESFVVSELQRQATWSRQAVMLYHYRTSSGEEVDAVLEDRAGRVVGVEVKLSGGLTAKDTKGLAHLREALGERFIRGAVIYTGDEFLPLGERLYAVPIHQLFAGEPYAPSR